jgi:hypothetical protein
MDRLNHFLYLLACLTGYYSGVGETVLHKYLCRQDAPIVLWH